MPPLRPMFWLTPAASVSICLQVRFLIIVLKTRLCLQSFCIHTVLPILQQINYCNQIFSYPLTSRWLHQTSFLPSLHPGMILFDFDIDFSFIGSSLPCQPPHLLAFQGIFISTCNVDVRWFPFDIQRCELKFGSWTFDGWLLDIQMKEADVSGYMPNGEWDLLGKDRLLRLWMTCSVA